MTHRAPRRFGHACPGHGPRRAPWAALLVTVGLLAAVPSPLPGSESILGQAVQEFRLVEGMQGIGGAQMEDFVHELRRRLRRPVRFEDLDLDREEDGITLAEAIRRLEKLDSRGELSPLMVDRLGFYRDLMEEGTFAPKEVILIDLPTFKLDVAGQTLRGLLDRAMEEAPQYEWEAVSARSGLHLLIKPKEESVLSWEIPSKCQDGSTIGELWGETGYLSTLFNEHGITLWTDPPDSNATLDLCREDLSARDTLIRTSEAAGADHTWSLKGIEGAGILKFEPLN